MLAGGIVTAHRAQPLRAQRSSVGGARGLVVHEVVSVGELKRVRKPHPGLLSVGSAAQNPGAVQRPMRTGGVKFHPAGGHALAAVLRVSE